MAVQSDALTTRTNLKSAVGIASADTSKDTYLDFCIDRATWLIEQMTNRKFNQTQGGLKARKYNGGASTHGTTGVTDEDYIYFDGTLKNKGGDTIINPDTGYAEFYLPAYPVQANAVVTFALAILTNRGSTVVGGETWDATQYVEFDDYIVDRQKGIIRLLHKSFAGGFSGLRNYRVTMAAGLQYGAAQPYVPPDLEACCIELAKQIFRESRNVSSESIGTWSRSWNLEKPDPVIQTTIARYTRYT